MIEALWAALLIAATVHPAARPLAFLLTVKWALNYAAFMQGAWAAPVYIDLTLGAVGIVLAARAHGRWADVVIAGFVVTPLVHGWFWIQRDIWPPASSVHYALIVGVFTAQAMALGWPGLRSLAEHVLAWLAVRRRGGLAAAAGVDRSRPDAPGS